MLNRASPSDFHWFGQSRVSTVLSSKFLRASPVRPCRASICLRSTHNGSLSVIIFASSFFTSACACFGVSWIDSR